MSLTSPASRARQWKANTGRGGAGCGRGGRRLGGGAAQAAKEETQRRSVGSGTLLFRGVAAAGLSSPVDPELEPRFVLATASSTL